MSTLILAYVLNVHTMVKVQPMISLIKGNNNVSTVVIFTARQHSDFLLVISSNLGPISHRF